MPRVSYACPLDSYGIHEGVYGCEGLKCTLYARRICQRVMFRKGEIQLFENGILSSFRVYYWNNSEQPVWVILSRIEIFSHSDFMEFMPIFWRGTTPPEYYLLNLQELFILHTYDWIY